MSNKIQISDTKTKYDSEQKGFFYFYSGKPEKKKESDEFYSARSYLLEATENFCFRHKKNTPALPAEVLL